MSLILSAIAQRQLDAASEKVVMIVNYFYTLGFWQLIESKIILYATSNSYFGLTDVIYFWDL